MKHMQTITGQGNTQYTTELSPFQNLPLTLGFWPPLQQAGGLSSEGGLCAGVCCEWEDRDLL